MKEFGIINIHTNEEAIIFGYNADDAYRRAKVDAIQWAVVYVDYID